MSTFTNIVTGADVAIVGTAADGAAIVATSSRGEGLHGETSSDGAAAVAGIAKKSGPGVYGESELYDGVVGIAKAPGKSGVTGRSPDGVGVLGVSDTGAAIVATSTHGEGLHGETSSDGAAAVAGIAKKSGPGVYGVQRAVRRRYRHREGAREVRGRGPEPGRCRRAWRQRHRGGGECCHPFRKDGRGRRPQPQRAGDWGRGVRREGGRCRGGPSSAACG